MTPRRLLALACLATALAPAAAEPLRLSLHAEGPQDLLLDAAPERPAVQYVAHGRPVAEPDTDNEVDRGVAQAVDADAPAAMLQVLAPVPMAAPDVPAQGWMLHEADPEPALMAERAADAPDEGASLVDAAVPDHAPALAHAVAEAEPAPGFADEVDASAERRRAQRLAVQWTVVPLVLVSLGLWWALGRRRQRRRSDGTVEPKPADVRRRRGHRHARRRAS
jgi:hypothetical protein